MWSSTARSHEVVFIQSCLRMVSPRMAFLPRVSVPVIQQSFVEWYCSDVYHSVCVASPLLDRVDSMFNRAGLETVDDPCCMSRCQTLDRFSWMGPISSPHSDITELHVGISPWFERCPRPKRGQKSTLNRDLSCSCHRCSRQMQLDRSSDPHSRFSDSHVSNA